jgi:predicted dehydrogenase
MSEFANGTRRSFLQQASLAALAGGVLPTWGWEQRTFADETRSPNERPRVGCIGNGGMGRGDGGAARRYGDIIANCDVDRSHAEKFRDEIAGGKSEIYEDYRALLDRNDIDVVTISTPDHWHTRIAIAALRAGKHVYCQKPLTLTIAEGKLLRDVVQETGRVLQVGTQQRSENANMFLKAVALCQGGRIGKIHRVTVAIGGAPAGGPFQKQAPPSGLNWDLWQGQTPAVDYITERCHGNFRWWYEYSGGKMTDWGAHHVDIAQWAIGMDGSGPDTVEVVQVTHPVELRGGHPTMDDHYNTATRFTVRCRFANGVEMLIRDEANDLGFDNGILFEGEGGRFFVNRGKLTGAPVDALQQNPLGDEVLIALRKGKRLDNHMANFMECARDGGEPVSDVASHHRALTTCHLANIALRLGRNLRWNPQTEEILDDPEANAWQAREQRTGYEVG